MAVETPVAQAVPAPVSTAPAATPPAPAAPAVPVVPATPAAATPAPAAPVPAAAPAAAPAAPAAAPAVVKPTSLLSDPPAPPAAGAPAPGTPPADGVTPAAEAKPGEAKPEAPAVDKPWDLKAPEWVAPETKAAFEKFGREYKLSVEQTQAILTRQTAAEVEAYNAQFKTFEAEIRADTEFGGDKFETTTLPAATRALKQLATPEERAFLEKTPYGSHPILIKILARAGARMSEDGFVAGSGTAPAPKSAAETFYPAGGVKPSTWK